MTITAFKCTRANGRDFYSNTVEYAVGAMLEHPDPEVSSSACGRGFHVSPTARLTCRYGNRDIDRGKWRWFEVEINEGDVLGRDDTKLRVRRLRVVRELTVVDVFGAKLADNVKAQRADVETWKNNPWLKPSRAVGEADLAPLCAQLHEAQQFWLAQRGINRDIPRKARIITDRRVAIDAADRVRRTWYADAAADAADAAAAAADAADAAAADAADAAAAAADADAAAAADADADAAAAAAAAAAFRPSWLWWYLRPYYVLWRHSRFILGGLTEPNPFAPIVAMYRLGVLPLGWLDGEFCIYVPPPVASK